jgi:hypothetical protein
MLTETEIGDRLYELYEDDAQRPVVSLARKVTDEHYTILTTLSDIRSRGIDRANKHYRKFDLELWQLWDLWTEQAGLCAVTKMPMSCEIGTWEHKNPWKVSIDRIDSDQDYVIDNVRLVTHWYNNAKNTWGDHVPRQALDAWMSAVKAS